MLGEATSDGIEIDLKSDREDCLFADKNALPFSLVGFDASKRSVTLRKRKRTLQEDSCSTLFDKISSVSVRRQLKNVCEVWKSKNQMHLSSSMSLKAHKLGRLSRE